MFFSDDNLLKELQALESEYIDLESIDLGNTSFDSVTIQRIKKRQSWILERMREVKSAIYPEVIA